MNYLTRYSLGGDALEPAAILLEPCLSHWKTKSRTAGRPRRPAMAMMRATRTTPPVALRKLQKSSSRSSQKIFPAKETGADALFRDLGSDDRGIAQSYLQSPERGLRQAPARRLLHERQADQSTSTDTPDLACETETHHGSPLLDLMSPLSPVTLSGNKRSLDEVLQDDRPPQKDKLSAEIDQLAGETPQPDVAQAGPSGTNRWETAHPYRRKRSRASRELSTSQTLGASGSDEQNFWPERRSELVDDITRPNSQTPSDD